ncbi:MAG: hypothetical protein ACRC6B_11905 [Fusobacteriaceae bacterium]
MPDQDTVNAFFLSASKLNEDLYIGDIGIDDEGVAKTSIIKADGTVETVTLDKDLQVKFQTISLASAAKVEAVVKMTKEEEESVAEEVL